MFCEMSFGLGMSDYRSTKPKTMPERALDSVGNRPFDHG
jgi:hypothetical protein